MTSRMIYRGVEIYLYLYLAVIFSLPKQKSSRNTRGTSHMDTYTWHYLLDGTVQLGKQIRKGPNVSQNTV